jgi:hypothetical protein
MNQGTPELMAVNNNMMEILEKFSYTDKFSEVSQRTLSMPS